MIQTTTILVTYFGQEIDENNPDGATYIMSNLNTAVKSAVAKTAQTGYSNETLYGKLHETIRPYVDKKTSNCMWSDKITKSGPSLNIDAGCYGMPGPPNGWA